MLEGRERDTSDQGDHNIHLHVRKCHDETKGFTELLGILKHTHKPGTVVRACDLSTRETEARESSQI